MEKIYLFSFLFSALWVVVTFIFGEALDGIGEADLDGLTFGHAWSIRSILVGILGFGVAGLLLTREMEWQTEFILGIAILIGILSGVSLEFLCIRPLKRLQSTSIVSEANYSGLEATVLDPIHSEVIGRILLVHRGMSLTYGAKPLSSNDRFESGSTVIIHHIDGSLAFVVAKTESEDSLSIDESVHREEKK